MTALAVPLAILAACSSESSGPTCEAFNDAGRGSPQAFELLGDAYFVVNPDEESVSGAQLFPLMGQAVAGCLRDPSSDVADHIR